MKFEIDVSDEAIKSHVSKSLQDHLFVDSYGQMRGTLAREFSTLAQGQVLAQIEALDLTGLIREAINDHLIPTIHEQVKKIIERESAKAIKKTMAEVKA